MAAQLDDEADRARFLADKRHVYAAGEELDAAIFGDEPYESFGRPC